MKTHLNILPLKFRKKLITRQIVPYWAVVWVVVAILSAVFCWDARQGLAETRRAFAKVDARAEPLRESVKRNQQTSGHLELADQRKLLVDCLQAADRPLQLIGLISANARTIDGSIHIQSFQLSQSEPVNGGASPPTDDDENAPQMKLGLQGYAVDDLALSRFISQLRATRVFDAVELQTSTNVQLVDGSARQYIVECQF